MLLGLGGRLATGRSELWRPACGLGPVAGPSYRRAGVYHRQRGFRNKKSDFRPERRQGWGRTPNADQGLRPCTDRDRPTTPREIKRL